MPPKTKPTQLYKIIKNDEDNKLIDFFIENPDFDKHHQLLMGRKFRLLEQAIYSKSQKCTVFLMNNIDFNILLEHYLRFLTRNYSENIFISFLILLSQHIQNDNNLLKKIIHHFFFHHERTPINIILNHFITPNSSKIIELLKNDEEYRFKFEEILINRHYDWSVFFINFYNKNGFDMEELYVKYLLKGDIIYKKIIKDFKNIKLDLNKKIRIPFTAQSSSESNSYYYYKTPSFYSNEKYSLEFILTIHNVFIKNYSGNFEEEFFTFMNDDFHNKKNDRKTFPNNIFRKLINTFNLLKINDIYKYEPYYVLNYFFNQKEDGDNTLLFKYFCKISYLFTDKIYDFLNEINDKAMKLIKDYIEQTPSPIPESDFSRYKKVFEETIICYESNKIWIHKLKAKEFH